MSPQKKKSQKRRPKNRPHILILMMDTQGARNMSVYGYRKPTTPNIAKLA